MRRYISLDENDIYYTVIYKKKKNISIKIDDSGEVIIYSPIGISYSYIEGLMIRKKNWIIKNINRLKNEYYRTNTVIFLGKEYIPKIEVSNTDKIYLEEEFIYIKTKKRDSSYIKSLILNWYIQSANSIIINRVDKLAIENNLLPSKVIIKDQKTRWGSCNSKKEIRLNWRLILMPYKIIDYIIVHELCHLKQMNHSKDFWALVNSICSDYKESEKWLKKNGHSIMIIK